MLESPLGLASPRLRQVAAQTRAPSYIDLLPRIYRRDDAPGGFLERLLALARTTLDEADAALAAVPRRFDPLRAPAEHLHWLASRLAFVPPADWTGDVRLDLDAVPIGSPPDNPLTFAIRVVAAEDLKTVADRLKDTRNVTVIKRNSICRIRFDASILPDRAYTVRSLPRYGMVELREPILTARVATGIAAVCIVTYAALAGLMSLAFINDILRLIG